MRKLERMYKDDETKFRKALNEISALLNRISENLNRVLNIFDIGKAYFNDKRVTKIFSKVQKMYGEFLTDSKDLKEKIKEKVSLGLLE